jgi:hypothetical protein
MKTWEKRQGIMLIMLGRKKKDYFKTKSGANPTGSGAMAPDYSKQ